MAVERGETARSVATPDDLTAEWLEHALGCPPIASFTVQRIGTGQMSESHRVTLTYADGSDGPPSVVLKVAAADEMTRTTGRSLGLYEREVRFYSEIAPIIGGPLAPCHHASFDPETGTFCLLLGDAAPAIQGDEVIGCTPDQARLAVAELGRLHAPALDSARLQPAGWLQRPSPITQALVEQLLAEFERRYRSRLAPEHLEVARRLAGSFEAYVAESEAEALPRGLVHGDYRLDNLLFGQPGAARPLTVVDWQTVTWGHALTDLAYFLGCSLTIENRRTHAEELLALYREAAGVEILTADAVAQGVRRQSFFGVMMSVISPVLVAQTERGDDMFMACFARNCQQALDLDALSILPQRTRPSALVPEADDEGPHPPGPEPLWNESWYFDVADPEQAIGAYVRLGLDPHENRAWYTALICGPGRPTVALVDFSAPLPGPDLMVTTERLRATQSCDAPLTRYRVTVGGEGESFPSPAALLRGEAGQPVQAELDLTWETDGQPYQYRLTTRYEIPCRVTGTVRIGEETFALHGAAGQRDHSWGVRDWWSMEWIWSAGHLSDGTHLHALDLRVPGRPPIAAGYVQPRDGEPVELTVAPAQAAIGADGLGATTMHRHDDLEVTFEPLGHGPLRLEADDGRVALFPRAWGTLRTSDGRTGVGWMEWNLRGA